MDEKTKAMLIAKGVDLLLTRGLPAVAEFFMRANQQNEKKKVTIDDIRALHGELDSESYFE